jgi:septal ring factor EnvC (AmiA/AmiB activator)
MPTLKETKSRIRELEKQTRQARENLYKLEAQIAALPAQQLQSRMAQRNQLPPLDDYAPVGSRKPRGQQRAINQQRGADALYAVVAIALLLVVAWWFISMLQRNGINP